MCAIYVWTLDVVCPRGGQHARRARSFIVDKVYLLGKGQGFQPFLWVRRASEI